jgi:hypothetical protein
MIGSRPGAGGASGHAVGLPRVPLPRLSTALIIVALAAGVVAGGLATAKQPALVLGAAVAACVFVLAFRMPVANLSILVFLTAVVPYDLLNRFSIAGGTNRPGLLASDVFLLAGLAWAILAVPHVSIDRRRLWYLVAMLGFGGIVMFEFFHGARAGYDLSVVGQETRALLGLGTFLIAIPLLAHRESRWRLLGSLAIVSLLLGAWGMLQWFGHFSYGNSGDVGVRAGVALTSGGTGQLQGGEFAYPGVVVMCFGALAYGNIRSSFWRCVLLLSLVLSAASCLVTFERSFWMACALGLAFVLVFTARGDRRMKGLALAGTAAAIALIVLSTFAPAVLTTAQQRLTSIGGYASDSSVRYRVVESQFVLQRVKAHPLTGSGMGATIFWGQPWAQVPPKPRNFAHDGYLWLAWKIGIPAAALLVSLFALTLIARPVLGEELLSFAVRRGAQGAILGLLLATVTFPSFSQLNISSVMGVLLALAISPMLAPVTRFSPR